MSESTTGLDLAAADAVVRQVESLWRRGQRPDPASVLAEAGLVAPAQVAAVLTADQWQRWRAGERVRAEDYLARHPAVAADPAAALLLVYGEFLLREERGEAPAPDEYLRRFPQYADALRLQLEFHRAAGGGAAGPTALFADAPTALRHGPGGGAGAEPAVPGYELHGRLGQGGMGVVWLGRDVRLGRDVAVKVMKEEFSGRPGVARRFIEEARVASQLAHPAIPPVHELGTLPDGRPYFAMKVVRGHTLAALLGTSEAPADDLPRYLHVFEQVCQAMAYAHSKGVIHRDLKPSNVMVGAFGEVQVMDWGLAKVLGQGPPGGESAESRDSAVGALRTADAGDATQTGSVLGTPAYMAPEQARGEVGSLDERCDVFGLGAILCEILTGRPPYTGTAEEVRRRAGRGEVGPAVRRLEACGADGELVELARHCLSPGPEGRPADADAVAAALTAHLAGVRERLRRAELERAAAEARAAEERKRRRAQLALAAAVLLCVAAGGGAALWVLQERAAQRQAAQGAVESALARAAELGQQARWGEAQAVVGQARQGLGQAGPPDLRRRLELAEAELALVGRLDAIRQRRAMIIVAAKLDGRAAARDYAAAFAEGGLGNVGDDEEAVAARVRASGVAGPLVAALDNWAMLTQEPATRAWVLGVARRADPDPWRDGFRDPDVWRDPQALRALADDALHDDGAKLNELSPQVLETLAWLLSLRGMDAVPLLRAAQRRYPNDFWLSLELGKALHAAKQYDEALGYDRVAVALRPDASAAHNNLGTVLYDKQDLVGATTAYRKALDLDPKNPVAHYNLGLALRDSKDLDGAIAEYRTAIGLDPRYAQAHHNLGNALHSKKDVDGAIAEYRTALDLDPNYVQAYINLGHALRDKKDPEGAVAAYRKALELDPKNASGHDSLGNALYDGRELDEAITEYRRAIECDPKYAPAYNGLGNVLYARRDPDGAADAYRRAIDLNPKDPVAHYNLGLALDAQQDTNGAIAEYRRALALDPDYPEAHCNLGQALRDQGRFAEALEELRRGDALGRQRPGWPYRSAEWVRRCERLLELDRKLPAVLEGTAQPDGPAERLELARLCQNHKRLTAGATRLYADAFADAPALADDLKQHDRYDAARSAALAAAGQGEDARRLPDKEQLMLRRQALAWLRDDLAEYAKLAERQQATARQFVRQGLAHWQQDANFTSVRDCAALDRLSDDERQPWRQLWEEVATLLKKVEEKK